MVASKALRNDPANEVRQPTNQIDRNAPPTRGIGWATWRAMQWKGTTADPAIGNGTLYGWTTFDGRWLEVWVELTIGSTTTFGTGGWYFTGQPIPTTTSWWITGWCGLRDDSAATSYAGPVLLNNLGQLFPRTPNYGGTNGAVAAVSSALPFTWATGDTLNLYSKFRYRT